MTDVSTDVATEHPREENRAWVEMIAAILLGVAGVLTAYAAYYGALAGGDALKGYSEATISRNEANGYYSDYGTKVAQDTNVFLQHEIQLQNGSPEAADYIRSRLFSAELETAYAVWLEIEDGSEDDVPTPMDMEEYVVEDLALYNEQFDLSNEQFNAAAEIDDQGDNMDLASVFLAVSLFFAGIAALFKVRRMSLTMLSASALLLIPGIWAICKGKGWIS